PFTLFPYTTLFRSPVRRSHRSRDRLVPRHLGCLIRRSLGKRTMSRPMEELRGYFAVHSQGLGHATRAVALARGLLERRRDLYLVFLAGSPALDLVVANGFDALTMPPAPDWRTTDGVLSPVWRWYRDYGRYLRIARRFLKGEADWDYYRFLLSDSELASAREAIRHRIPTALILDATRHEFARDPLSHLVEGPANFWASRIARKADLVLSAESAPNWPNVRRIGPIVRT